MKLSIICSISHHPDILILDEATTGLDPVVRDEILDLFLDFIQDEKHSILFSTHITSDIQRIADYVVLIHNGKLIFEEQKDEMIYNYGIIRCKKADFSQINPDDYLISRETTLSMECLVHDREAVEKKYSNFIVDNASIEDIIFSHTGIFCLRQSIYRIWVSFTDSTRYMFPRSLMISFFFTISHHLPVCDSTLKPIPLREV